MTSPHQAAKRRFANLMRWALALALIAVGVAYAWLIMSDTPLALHLFIAVGLGIIATVMLTAALMGLVFLSSATGRDSQVGLDDNGGPRP